MAKWLQFKLAFPQKFKFRHIPDMKICMSSFILARLSATKGRTVKQIILNSLNYFCSYQTHKIIFSHALTDTSILC